MDPVLNLSPMTISRIKEGLACSLVAIVISTGYVLLLACALQSNYTAIWRVGNYCPASIPVFPGQQPRFPAQEIIRKYKTLILIPVH